MEANEMGTIQHHPIHIQGLSYAAMAIQPGSGKIFKLNFSFLLSFSLSFSFFFFLLLF
jgi:hypothetical protein